MGDEEEGVGVLEGERMSKCLACNKEGTIIVALLITTEGDQYSSSFTLCSSCSGRHNWVKKSGDYVYLICKEEE